MKPTNFDVNIVPVLPQPSPAGTPAPDLDTANCKVNVRITIWTECENIDEAVELVKSVKGKAAKPGFLDKWR